MFVWKETSWHFFLEEILTFCQKDEVFRNFARHWTMRGPSSLKWGLFSRFRITANFSGGDPGAKRRKSSLLLKQPSLSLFLSLSLPLSLSLFLSLPLSLFLYLSLSLPLLFPLPLPFTLPLFFPFSSSFSLSLSLSLSLSPSLPLFLSFSFLVDILLKTLEVQKGTRSTCRTPLTTSTSTTSSPAKKKF